MTRKIEYVTASDMEKYHNDPIVHAMADQIGHALAKRVYTEEQMEAALRCGVEIGKRYVDRAHDEALDYAEWWETFHL